MSRKSKSNQARPKCIFCGKSPLTKEHLWPDWMKDIIRRADVNHHLHILNGTTMISNESQLYNETRVITGHPGTRKFKIVCEACNNGWMSQIENDAKSVLSQMMLGESLWIDREEQTKISRWAVLKTIIKEYDDLPRQAITDFERKKFFLDKNPPLDWCIWIGRNKSRSENYKTYHTGVGIYNFKEIDFNLPIRSNTQNTTFIVGNLLLYTYKKHEPSYDYGFLGDWGRKLVPIFPARYTTINWQSVSALEIEEIESLYSNLQEHLNLNELVDKTPL